MTRDLKSDALLARSDAPYLLGRAYAIRQWIYAVAEGEARATVSDRWTPEVYAEASLWPVRSAGRLGRMTAEDARRARRRNPESARALIEDLDRCMGRVDDRDLSEPLSNEASSAWITGHHQQQAEYLRRGLEFARASLDEALESAKAQAVALVEGGMSELEAARRVGLDRMTVRKALGKR